MRMIAAMLLLMAAPGLAQPAPDRPSTTGANPDRGSEAVVSSEKPLADADDPINRQAAAETVEALIVSLTLDGREARLDSAVPARVPRGVIQKRQDEGDRVTVIALAGGREIARTSVPDQVINIEENKGLVQLTRRQISLAVPMGRAPDKLQVLAPATGVDTAVDPGPMLAMWCQSERPNPWCPRQR
jgi:hypothetical protein